MLVKVKKEQEKLIIEEKNRIESAINQLNTLKTKAAKQKFLKEKLDEELVKKILLRLPFLIEDDKEKLKP